jgi:predicted Zn finger-like uncharacterized protein
VFTQCPKCETVFRLSAGALRAAGGQVRCGRCGNVFNALERLAEHAAEFPKGESPRELEARADAILESAAALEPPAPAEPQDGDIAHLELHDDSLGFSLPPDELDREFVETGSGPLRWSVTAPGDSLEDANLEEANLEEARLKDARLKDARLKDARLKDARLKDARLKGARLKDTQHEEPPESGLKVREDVSREVSADYAPRPVKIAAPRRSLHRAAWASAAAVLAVLLLLQVIRTNGDWLAASLKLRSLGKDPVWKDPVGKDPVWKDPAGAVSAYRLQKWGVTGDPQADGTLQVRASLVNMAAQPRPYPLLRVTLTDRFGALVGRREFGAAEYLHTSPASLLAPGEKVDAVLDILDPGKDAEGFEIEVCVRNAMNKLSCRADAGPPTR